MYNCVGINLFNDQTIYFQLKNFQNLLGFKTNKCVILCSVMKFFVGFSFLSLT